MTASLVLANARLILPDRIVPGSVAVTGDRIDAVLPQSASLPRADRTIDLDGAYLSPGFVDIHIHGSAGVDVMTASEDELARMAGWLATCGVTRFVPTLIASSLDQYRETTARIAAWIGRTTIDPPAGAVPLGIHFEGPFVNTTRCGALHARNFLDGTRLGEFFEAVGADRLDGLPSRMITVAPEIDGGLDVVR